MSNSQNVSGDRLRAYLRTAIEDAASEPVTEEDVARIRFIQKLTRDMELGGNWAVTIDEAEVLPP